MSRTILVADDSKTIRRAIELTFRSTDFSVVAVDSADQAMAALGEVRPDVILADASMPGTDGYALCAALKGNASTSGIPVLLMASQFDPFDEGRGMQARADGHIDKPWDSQSLINLVRQVSGLPVDGTAPQSFAATLAQRQQQSAPSNGQPAPSPFGAPVQEQMPSTPPPPTPPPAPRVEASAPPPIPVEEVVIEEPEDVAPSLEPPRPPTGAPRANVDMWSLDDSARTPDAGPPPGTDDAIEEIAIDDVPIDEEIPIDDVGPAIADQAAPAVARAAMAAMPGGLPEEQMIAVAREVIERVAWEVVPELAETIIRQELQRLLAE